MECFVRVIFGGDFHLTPFINFPNTAPTKKCVNGKRPDNRPPDFSGLRRTFHGPMRVKVCKTETEWVCKLELFHTEPHFCPHSRTITECHSYFSCTVLGCVLYWQCLAIVERITLKKMICRYPLQQKRLVADQNQSSPNQPANSKRRK